MKAGWFRNTVLLVGVAALPCLVCSGLAALVGGAAFGRRVLVTVLLLDLVLACGWLAAWLFSGRPPSPGRGPDEGDRP
jgi:hypothetical protein